jgi:hypothetical protein
MFRRFWVQIFAWRSATLVIVVFLRPSKPTQNYTSKISFHVIFYLIMSIHSSALVDARGLFSNVKQIKYHNATKVKVRLSLWLSITPYSRILLREAQDSVEGFELV